MYETSQKTVEFLAWTMKKYNNRIRPPSCPLLGDDD